ncbi:MAG: O-antigen ligase family protein [Deltaproteobacteria bacterium]|nr:O-antigen ligase family protein [Deltaproteobacteria bacterium]
MPHADTQALPAPAGLRAARVVLQLGALACVLAALPFPLFDLDRHSVPKELVVHATVAVSTLLCAALASRLALTRLDGLLAGYLAAAAASAALASNPWLSFRTTALLLSGGAAFWAARYLAARLPTRPLLVALAVGTVLAAVTGLAQAYGWTTELAAVSRAPGGTFGNRNFMAHLLAVGLPVLLLAAGTARSRIGFWAGACGVTLVSAALTLSRSRAAWLAVGLSLAAGAAAALLAGGLLRRPGFRVRGLLLALAGAAGVAAAATLPNALDWRSKSPYLDSLRHVADYQTGSGRVRLIQYRNTWRIAADHFVLGVGPGNWAVEYSRYRTRRDPSVRTGGGIPSNPWPSSDWMALLAEQGLLGLVLFALVTWAIFKKAWDLLRGGGDAAVRFAGLALLATTVSAAVGGGFDVILHMATPALYFWLAAGSLLPAARVRYTFPLQGRLARGLLLGAVGVIGALAVHRSASQVVAMTLVSSARTASVLEKASRVDPGSYRIRVMAAEAWLRRGRPDLGRSHAEAAGQLFPYLPEPKLLADRCGRRTASADRAAPPKPE